jgi:hypothetical protein
VTRTHQGSVSLQSSSSSAAAAEETTLQIIVDAVSGKKQSELCRKDGVSTHLPAPKSAPGKTSPEQEKLCHGWNHVDRVGRVVKAHAFPSLTSTSSDTGRRTERRLPQRSINVSPLVLKCRRWNPSHPIPKRLIQRPLPHRVSLRSRGSPISSRTFPLRPA